jgi:Ulp1 family protease
MQAEFYKIRLVPWVRQQSNGCDCAIFTALNARLMGQTSQVDEEWLVTQREVTDFWRAMCKLEAYCGQLCTLSIHMGS